MISWLYKFMHPSSSINSCEYVIVDQFFYIERVFCGLLLSSQYLFLKMTLHSIYGFYKACECLWISVNAISALFLKWQDVEYKTVGLGHNPAKQIYLGDSKAFSVVRKTLGLGLRADIPPFYSLYSWIIGSRSLPGFQSCFHNFFPIIWTVLDFC